MKGSKHITYTSIHIYIYTYIHEVRIIKNTYYISIVYCNTFTAYTSIHTVRICIQYNTIQYNILCVSNTQSEKDEPPSLSQRIVDRS